jgi:DNA repair protein RadB
MAILKIPTGTETFDDLLEGGYEKDILTTIYGPSASGKTTLCLLASIIQARQKNKVIFIDTEGGFSLERMKQLTGEELEEILKYIILLKPTSFEEQDNSLKKLKGLINDKIGLIVIDTLTIFYRLELAKNNTIKEANNKLIQQVSYLVEIARKNSIPILITNQVYSDFHKKDEVKMVGGDILKYSSKCLIKLKNLTENKRKAILISHRSIPEGKEAIYAIINEGIINSKERSFKIFGR